MGEPVDEFLAELMAHDAAPPTQPTALVPRTATRPIPAVLRPEMTTPAIPARRPAQAPLVIAPSSTRSLTAYQPRPRITRRPRPWAMQAAVAALTLCVLLTVSVIGAMNASAGSFAPWQTFAAFANGSGVAQTTDATIYRVQTGDTIESIAHTYNVAIGGVYKLNGLYLGDEITVGEALKIPTSPSYGADYQPIPRPLPPPPTAQPPTQPTASGAKFGPAPAGTIFGPCVFCSYAGDTTGPSGPCAPAATTNLGFGLIQPNPGAHWVRGFTWYHNGVDLSTSRLGTKLIAAQSGQVIFSGWDQYGGGYSVKINHCHGLATSYGHMQIIYVKTGQFVHQGDVIGLQGSTGNSTGPHVHFMVWWHNQYVDPLKFYTHLGFPYP